MASIPPSKFFTGSGPNYIFPGEVLTPDNVAPGLLNHSFYDQAQAGLSRPAAPLVIVSNYRVVTPPWRKAWLLFNWLLRPPLTDEEIVSMPNMELVKLFYSLNVTLTCAVSRPNAVNSRGLPYAHGINHDSYNTQNRIYKLRPDLHSIKDSYGRMFPILLPVDQVRAPACDETGTAIQALSAFASILTFGAAWYVTLVLTVAEESASAVNQAEQNALISHIEGQFNGVLNGIQLAKVSLIDPQPNESLLEALSMQRKNWQELCAVALQYQDEILSLWPWMTQPELWTAIYYDPGFDGALDQRIYKNNPGMKEGINRENPTGPAHIHATLPWLASFFMQKAQAYVDEWEPYQKFFYSDAVASMVDQYEQRLQSASAGVTP